MLHHCSDFGVEAEWHYFATAHGKGPSDGLGGTLKRLATRASLQGTQIQTPKELFTWAKGKLSLNVAFVRSAECLDELEILKPRFEEAVAVTSIRSYHAAIVEDQESVRMQTTSSSTDSKIFKIVKAGKRQTKTLKSTRKTKN